MEDASTGLLDRSVVRFLRVFSLPSQDILNLEMTTLRWTLARGKVDPGDGRRVGHSGTVDPSRCLNWVGVLVTVHTPSLRS